MSSATDGDGMRSLDGIDRKLSFPELVYATDSW